MEPCRPHLLLTVHFQKQKSELEDCQKVLRDLKMDTYLLVFEVYLLLAPRTASSASCKCAENISTPLLSSVGLLLAF